MSLSVLLKGTYMAKHFVRQTASQQVAVQIQRQIDEGSWAVGSSLPSMRELAIRFGVSLTTIQKAMQDLSHKDVIDLRPRQGGIVKVTKACAPSPRDQIGLVVMIDPEVSVPLWWQNSITHAAQVVLAESGYRLTMFNCWYRKPDHAKQVIAAMESSIGSLAGMFSFLMDGIVELTKYFDSVDLPWMTVNPTDWRTHHNFVMADNLAGGRMVGHCFARLGYERVAVLYDELKGVSPLEKVTGLCQGYLENEISPAGIQLVRCADMQEPAGFDAMREYLKHHVPPQGIFATGDSLAIGAMRACQDMGLRIPQDIGVVGATGVPLALLRSDPPLTELCQPVQAMGRQLALCLLEMIRGGVCRISGRRIPCSFVLRESLDLPESIRRELQLNMPSEIESTEEVESESLVETTIR
jgi:DNA-binding LacI/PurR family transcriptional regulator